MKKTILSIIAIFTMAMVFSQSICKIERKDSANGKTKNQIYLLTKTFIAEQWKPEQVNILIEDKDLCIVSLKNKVTINNSGLKQIKSLEKVYVYTIKFLITGGGYNLLIDCENCEYPGLMKSGYTKGEWGSLTLLLNKYLIDVANKYEKAVNVVLDNNQINVPNLNYDDITLISLNKKINNIQLNLESCHKQFRTGTVCIGVGIGLSAIGMFCVMNYAKRLNNPDYIQPNEDLRNMGVISSIVGGGFITIGGVIQIDSHKWIGRAGKK